MGYIKQAFKYIKNLNTRGFWVGFIAGLFYFAYIFWWLWSLNLTESMGIEGKTISYIIILIIFLICISVTALFWGIFGFFTEKILKKSTLTNTVPFIIAGAFTLAEFIRSIFFSMFWFGDGGIIGPNWPLGNIAYLFTNFDYVLKTASFWGIYGITFFVVWLGTVLLLFFKQTPRKNILFQLGSGLAVIFIMNLGYKHNLDASEKLPSINLAVIQTNVSSSGYSNQDAVIKDFKTKLELLKQAAEEIREGIIIFPEGSNVTRNLNQFLNPDGLKNYFNKLSDKEMLILDSMRIRENKDFFLRTVFINSQSGVIGFYDKQILVPIGEYLPYVLKIPIRIINSKFIDRFNLSRNTTKGSGTDIVEFNNLSIKIGVCSEIIPPDKSRGGNPDILIFMGSYSIWNGSSIAQRQIISSARFRAVENQKYLVLAANSEQSYVINPLGRIEKSTHSSDYELLTGSIIPNKGRTWYNYVGDWPILLLSSAFFAVGLRKLRNDPKS